MSLRKQIQQIWSMRSEMKASLLKRGGFGRNLTVVFSSNLIAQIIGILVMPIISRLYDPVAYGQFAIFTTICANLAVFSSLLYSKALVLPKEDKDFRSLLQLCLLLTLSLTTLVTITFLLLGESIFTYFDIVELYPYWILIPLNVLVLGLFQIMGGWNVRFKQFEKASIFPLIRAVLGKGFNIGYAIILSGSFVGLLWGEVLTSFIVLIVGYFLTMNKPFLKALVWQGKSAIWRVAKQFKNYPLLMLPSRWISVLSESLTIFMLVSYTGATMTGLYVFGNRLLSLPLSVIENAISPVFLQKGAELVHTNKSDLRSLVQKSITILLAVGILPFAVLTVFGDIIFYYVFGSQWEEAGKIAAYLGVLFMFKLPWAMTVSLLKVLRRELFLFSFSVGLLAIRGLTLFVGLDLYGDFYLALLLFSLGNSIAYLLSVSYLLYLLRISVWKFILTLITGVSVAIGSIYLIRLILIELLG